LSDTVSRGSSGRKQALTTEEAALRQVALLVARNAPLPDVLDAVAEQVARIFGQPWIGVMQYDSADSFVVIATWGEHPYPVGSRMPLDGPSTFEVVYRTGRPAAVLDYRGVPGTVAAEARKAGILGGFGAPIIVEGVTWGVIAIPATRGHPIPEDAELRLSVFAELVATAISNAQTRDTVSRLLEEQAALRRVAVLVAQQSSPEEVFTAVAEAVGPLVGADMSAVIKFPDDVAGTVVAFWSRRGETAPVGLSVPLDEDGVAARVFHSVAPARIDEPGSGTASKLARRYDVRSAVGAPVLVEGKLWGVLAAAMQVENPLPEDAAERIAGFAELVATAISNASARAELVASRARIVAAGDEARRRIERNLHDGIQQRLLALDLDVQSMQGRLPAGDTVTSEGLDALAHEIKSVLEDVRTLSQGLHPALLSRAGLGPSLKALARRSPIPVDLDIGAVGRVAEPIEVAAYFVASEALANAAKHSHASRIGLSLEQRDRSLWLSIGDDGVGGANSGGGSGLVGLSDRVEALGG
jgi:signal transduction histidine kinase